MKPSRKFDNLSPYVPVEPFEILSTRMGKKPEEIIKLDANENLFGPSPKALKALAELKYPHIYPDPENRRIRSSLSSFTGAPVENLFAGAGSDELIDLLLRAMLDPEDGVIICRPTFPMYDFDTVINGGKLHNVPRNQDFSIDLPGIIQTLKSERVKMIFLADPNNPTGNMLTNREVETLLSFPVLVVLDEAYIEYCSTGGKLGENQSRIKSVLLHENLVVLRTFSKWAGLAGLRMGYGAFPNWLMKILWKIKQPYNVNIAATEAAISTLEDLDFASNNLICLRSERDRLFKEMDSISFLEPYPSQAAFILCRVVGRNAADLQKDLMDKGIMVRYYNTPELTGCVRFSIGRPDQNDVLMDTLHKFENPTIR